MARKPLRPSLHSGVLHHQWTGSEFVQKALVLSWDDRRARGRGLRREARAEWTATSSSWSRADGLGGVGRDNASFLKGKTERSLLQNTKWQVRRLVLIAWRTPVGLQHSLEAKTGLVTLPSPLR